MAGIDLGKALVVVALASFEAAACGHGQEDERQRQDVRGLAVPTTAEARRLADWAERISPAPAPGPAGAAVSLPSRAHQPIRIVDEGSGAAAEVVLAGALDAAAERAGALSVYRDALGLDNGKRAAVLVREHADGFEDFVVLPDAPAASRLDYTIALGNRVAGLRLVGDTLELVDREGAPRLRVRPPYLVDAAGMRHPAHLAIEGCEVDTNPSAPWGRAPTPPGARHCSMAVTWESAGVSWPAVLDPAWSTTGSMISRRENHTATLLDNGRVLVAGGRDTGALSAAELYDPSTGTWAATGAMTGARSEHTAVLLTNGNVLVAGGRIAVALETAELYSTASGTWAATASMAQGRRGHRAVRLVTTEVLVAGGEAISGKVATVELFSPSTSTWQTMASMHAARAGHTLTALANGAVLVAGGENAAALSSAELYSRTNDSWLATDSMSSARTGHAALVLASGKVLVTGGSNGAALATAELYDPVAETFSDVPSMTTARFAHASVLLSNGAALIAGGQAGTTVGSSELFDPVALAWIPAGNLIEPRSSAPALSLGTQRALLIGGHGASGPLSSAEVFALQPDGRPCTQRGECDSGFCVDGVCCESACAMPCMACSTAVKGQGADGLCEPVEGGLDPDDDCQPTGNPPCETQGTCNGFGGCSTIVGFQCAPSACASDLVQTNVSVCNAALECVPSGSTDCSPYRCENGGCLPTCTSSGDCMPGSACIQSACVSPGANGAPCAVAGECASGHCVDGVCCDTACLGTCQACKGALKSTGFDGTCGAAKYGVPCGSTTCSNGQVTGQLCNSTGQCLSQSAPCSPYAACADSTACPTECTADGDCIAGYYCAPDGQCATQLLVGAACTGATQCQTGFCVDEVCCATSCGNGATDDCRACSAATGSTGDGTCAALDAVPCATGMCSNGICKSVPDAGADVEDGGEVDAPEEAADAAQEAQADAIIEESGPEASAPEASPEASYEASVQDAAEEAGQDAATGQPGAQPASDDGGGCSCEAAGREGGHRAWLLAMAGLLAGWWLRRERRSKAG